MIIIFQIWAVWDGFFAWVQFNRKETLSVMSFPGISQDFENETPKPVLN